MNENTARVKNLKRCMTKSGLSFLPYCVKHQGGV